MLLGVLPRVHGRLVYLGEGFVPSRLGHILLGLLEEGRFEELVCVQHLNLFGE
jgi:hypothetical protein